MYKTCEIILRGIDATGKHRYCALELDMDDPEFLNKVKQHIEIFKTIIKGN
jgi:hypothetical protein